MTINNNNNNDNDNDNDNDNENNMKMIMIMIMIMIIIIINDNGMSKTVTGNDSVTILWDMPIHNDRTIAVNRPDIVLKNKKDKTCLLIYMTVPFDTKIGNCWELKTTTVAVIMGALGTTKKDMENFSNKIPGNINIYELQKITLLSTAHLLRWVLSIIIIIIIYKCCLRLDYSRKQNKKTYTQRKKKT